MSGAWRPISDREKQVVSVLLSQDFPGNEALRSQLETASVSVIDAEGSLRFRVSGTPATVESRVPTEGYYFDRGANERPAINVLLHVLGGMLHELEIYKDDGSSIETSIGEVDPDSLRLL
jgi:hypothetical protein